MDEGLNQTRMRMLGELAEMTLVLARDLQQSALVAEDHDEKVRLAGAFHRIGRGLRQTLALHARVERDAERAIHEDAATAAEAAVARRKRRKAHIKGAVERLIWTEHDASEEESDGHDLAERLDSLLDAEAELEGFEHADPDAVIAGLCRVLKLQDPPPQGAVSAQRTEGVEAHSPPRSPASQPPRSLRDSFPSGGTSDPDPSG